MDEFFTKKNTKIVWYSFLQFDNNNAASENVAFKNIG